MNAVVAQFAGAVIPVPVPVVVEPIRVERSLRRRPQPQVIVNARRHGGILLVADGLALAGDPGADERHLAKFARTDKLGSAQDVRSAAALRPGLDDALVLARRLDHAPALDDVVRDRLLDVDVLAGLAGPD